MYFPMSKLNNILLSLIVLLLVFPVLSSAGQFRITMVYDGDTVKAETPEIVIYIMLVGIDAPEVSNRPDGTHQPFAQAAKRFLSTIVLNKTVVVKGYGTMPYPDNHIISEIYLDGKNVNLEMVKHGMAEAQRENLPKGFEIEPYLKAEEEARRVRNGMWVLKQEYISPRKWRKTLRGN